MYTVAIAHRLTWTAIGVFPNLGLTEVDSNDDDDDVLLEPHKKEWYSIIAESVGTFGANSLWLKSTAIIHLKVDYIRGYLAHTDEMENHVNVPAIIYTM